MCLADGGRTSLAYENFDGTHVRDNRATLLEDAQKGCPQGRSKRRSEANPLGYIEGLRDAGTLLADFFSIRLKLVERLIPQDCERFRCVRDSQHNDRAFPLSRRGTVAAFNINACLRQQIRHFF